MAGPDSSISRTQLEQSGSEAIPSEIFKRVVHKTRMPMAMADPNLPDCPLVFVNPAFCEMTGYEAGEVLGRNCRFLQGPDTDPDAVRQIREAVAGHRPVQVEIYNYRRDGSGFWNALFISPVFDDDGRLSYFFASQFDSSLRREALRQQAQRVESMGALASGVAHEFNNLMTVVLGSIERASTRAVDPVQARQLERADWGAQRAGKLASELLSLARRQDYDSRVVDLGALVREFGDTLAQITPAGVQLELDLPPEPMLVRLDPERLELVLLNLVRNALDAMPAGGRITVVSRTLPQPEAAAILGGKAVELLVADTGEGMTPEVAKRATELFFTTKTNGKGTGLGLFLALEFVDKCGGRLAISSEAGLGTRVKLVFPHAS